MLTKLLSLNPKASVLGLFLLIFLSSSYAFSQQESATNQHIKWKISALVDAFYVHDFNQTDRRERQLFLFNHNRKQEVNINLALLQFNLNHDKYRVNFALQTGTYPKDNYTSERGLLKNIHEATVGVVVCEPKIYGWI